MRDSFVAMTTEGTENGQRLDDIVREANDYYAKMRQQHINQTKVHVTVFGSVVWFAVFAGLGIAGYVTLPAARIVGYLLWAFLTAIVSGVVVGGIMYTIRRKRGFKLDELGATLDKMKVGEASSEDGLRLMDLLHQATLTMRKQRLDSAVEYGVGTFILVSVVGLNAGFGALAGVVTYLYFRFEALRDFEREEQKYEQSKMNLLQSL